MEQMTLMSISPYQVLQDYLVAIVLSLRVQELLDALC
jgi:hypothetical protein